ncbi:MAG TPA: dihydrolipoyl dehydrogenase [Planctomycetota bacterium]|nr:dihydrolipoyl dehydrogenase [Planctomycetota bacterium]
MAEAWDMVVIGAGPGGYVAAIAAAQQGFRVACVEKEKLGGTCLNKGCIPTKALIHSAEVFDIVKHAGALGIDVASPTVNFPAIVERSRKIADRMTKGIEFLFRKYKVTKIAGTAKLAGPTSVTVTDASGAATTHETRAIVIATGGKPRSLPGVDFDGTTVLSSTEAMQLGKQPASLVIVGAGAIGVEFAYFYATLGTQVTVVEFLDHVLPNEDAEVAEVLAKSFTKRGIALHMKSKVTAVAKTGAGVQVTIEDAAGGNARTVEAEKVLVAVGVEPNTAGLGLEEAGVKLRKGFIESDPATGRTAVESIYAVGDVSGHALLAHAAFAQAHAAVHHFAHPAAEETTTTPFAERIPRCVYCLPEVASIGLTEAQAKARGLQVKVGKFPYMASGRAVAIGETEGFVKLVFDAADDTLVGGQIIGVGATEIITELSLAKTLEATAEEILQTVHAHPTLAEMLGEAAGVALGKAIHI